jgi:anthranilate phosphoribosyltransferase
VSSTVKHQLNHQEFEQLKAQIIDAKLTDVQITDLALILKEKLDNNSS